MNNKEEMIFQLELRPQQNKEFTSWKKMCKQIQSMLNLTDSEFNSSSDIRELCQKIAIWGYQFAILKEQSNPLYPDMKPIFYPKKEESD